ncbi:MAG: hypothetical protein CMN29_30600 [Sandaracinus sp.]|nr:hypothetical protein [Sandaracinus sp.]
MRRRLPLLALLFALGLVAQVFADAAPWRRRRRPDIRSNRRSRSLVLPTDWPAEPTAPDAVDPERFARALNELCGWMPPARPARYTGYILRWAERFEVDPFLLGGLMYRMGRCRPDAEGLGGHGLTLIPRRMYGDYVRRGRYAYFVQKPDGDWEEKALELPDYPFSEHRLRRAEENLYFAAAFLHVWREQHQSLAHAYDQHPHRHYVSHFIWGDRVISDRAEDRVLTDRRRLLQYYGATPPPAPVERLGLSFVPPLDGAPRVISSWLGAERDGGERSHRGIDIESELGEPVRAAAAGRVNFAGVDLPGSRNNRNMEREEIEAVPRDDLGRGGRYVCILHHPPGAADAADEAESEGEDAESEGEDAESGPPRWLRTCYMHLEDVEVEWGDEVEAGQRIGTVGRTGMRRSAPHLHFELHSPEGVLDASEVLDAFLLGRNPDAEE